MTRRAHIETEHGDSETATAVANAVTPDNTDAMSTRVEGATVSTTIERESTGGLQATVDDYVVNLHLAAQLTTTDGDSSTANSKHNT